MAPFSRLGEKGVRLAQKMQVGPCISAGTQLERAEVCPTSGPTRRLSHSGQAPREINREAADSIAPTLRQPHTPQCRHLSARLYTAVHCPGKPRAVARLQQCARAVAGHFFRGEWRVKRGFRRPGCFPRWIRTSVAWRLADDLRTQGGLRF